MSDTHTYIDESTLMELLRSTLRAMNVDPRKDPSICRSVRTTLIDLDPRNSVEAQMAVQICLMHATAMKLLEIAHKSIEYPKFFSTYSNHAQRYFELHTKTHERYRRLRESHVETVLHQQSVWRDAQPMKSPPKSMEAGGDPVQVGAHVGYSGEPEALMAKRAND
jgi:hypothetical protein